MIPVSRLLLSVRYALRDMQGAAYSDFEIVEALNRAAGLLFERMGQRFIWAALKRTALNVSGGAAALPSDLHNIRKVGSDDWGELAPASGTPKEGQYRAAGDTFYAPDGLYSLEYWYIPAQVYGLSDNLDAPQAVSPYLERMALANLNGDGDGMEAAARACCDHLAGGDLSELSDLGPTRVLGGKL